MWCCRKENETGGYNAYVHDLALPPILTSARGHCVPYSPHLPTGENTVDDEVVAEWHKGVISEDVYSQA